MRKINVLAWDDEPEDLEKLAVKLAKFNIFLQVEEKEEDFIDRFDRENWDFIILDIVDQSVPGDVRDDAGIQLAARIRLKNKQIFILFVTDDGRVIAEANAITGPFHTRSKLLPDGSMINDIREFIELYVPDLSKVFLLCGRDRKAGQIRSKLTARLEDCGLLVDSSEFEDFAGTASHKFIERISRCGGFVALCTPDDKCFSSEGEYFQPSSNILLGIGVVIGLNRGLERLIILQKTGQSIEENARLPRVLQYDSAVRFEDEAEHNSALDKVITLLKQRGLKILT